MTGAFIKGGTSILETVPMTPQALRFSAVCSLFVDRSTVRPTIAIMTTMQMKA
ncbi:MAG: hypothetical protein KKG54_13475 [Alphaproteobacteria bacterium]|nr:hypothetical protein [Alphaproteobacteria bacterium]